MTEIQICNQCHTYTLQQTHCNQKTEVPKPPKFSVQDKYEQLKRDAKKEDLIKRGLL